MKCQDLFSSENKKKSKLFSALVVIGTLRVIQHFTTIIIYLPSQLHVLALSEQSEISVHSLKKVI